MGSSVGGTFECQCDARFRSACWDLGFYGEAEGKKYCVLHFPGKEKETDGSFREAVDEKLTTQRLDFSGVYFPSVTLAGFEFEDEVDFTGATFSGDANFSEATFSVVANFSRATFSVVANFFEATFSGVANFSEATFSERVLFSNVKTLPETALVFREATIGKPDRVSFHSMHLRPSWFVDVDAQKFDFSDVEWFRMTDEQELTIDEEIEALANRRIKSPISLRKLQKACRRLMNNAEENRDYQTANELHYWSMEAQRKEGWRRLGLIATLYWALSGYGERPLRAFFVAVGIWISFAILYLIVGSPELRLVPASGVWQAVEHAGRALVYSLAAIARLNPEPRPDAPGLFQFLVTTEGILGPLQIALFALAARRTVMR